MTMHPVHPYRKEHPHSKLLLMEAVAYLAFVIFVFMLLGFVTNANPAAVLLSFLPAILFGVIMIVLIETDYFFPTYNWLVLAMLLVAGSIILFMIPNPTVQGIDAGTVLIMNGILMAAGLLVMHNSYAHEAPHYVSPGEPESEARPVEHHTHVHVAASSHNIRDVADVVHSIEDKVKALNFVIGRVYSVYHGGTDRLRNKIRIDKSWYEEFNVGSAGDNERRHHEAIVLLSKIRDRLVLLKKTEREIFGDEVTKLKNIAHAPDGDDQIIAVLIKNDKDPVKRYYDGALEFCTNALKELSRGAGTQYDPHDKDKGSRDEHPQGHVRAPIVTMRNAPHPHIKDEFSHGQQEDEFTPSRPTQVPPGDKPGIKRGYASNEYEHGF